MREKKFRAWDKKNNCWLKKPCVINLEGLVFFEYLGGGAVQKDIELVEFTGLKDKNGKEIYEGDILGYWGGNKNGAKWIVGWDKNKSGWAAIYGETDITNFGESMSGMPAFKLSKKLCEKKEIIGNIYENKELIK